MIKVVSRFHSCMRLKGLGEKLSTHQYPATSDELIDAYGESQIELPEGTETLGSVLGRTSSETFLSSAEVHETLQGNVGHEAVGRRFYSDRDAPTVAEDGPEQVSF